MLFSLSKTFLSRECRFVLLLLLRVSRSIDNRGAMPGGPSGGLTSQLRPVKLFDEVNLPANLTGVRAARGRDVTLGRATFLPSDEAETVVAILATWNMLDAMMYSKTRLTKTLKNGQTSINVGGRHAWQTGYVREIQVRRMVQLARRAHVRNYCEVC